MRDVNLRVSIFTICVLIFSGLSPFGHSTTLGASATSSGIDAFKDDSLRKCILGKATKRGDVNELGQVTEKTLQSYTSLDCSARGVKDLTGIEQLTGLTYLTVSGSGECGETGISDLSPLQGLQHLKNLNVSCNNITTLENIGDHPTLHALSAWGNSLTNLSGIENTPSLRSLYLVKNQIDDITSIRYLQELTNFHASNNYIENIEPLTQLPKLEEIGLENNRISDLKPLLHYSPSNYHRGLSLELSGNRISDASPLSAVPGLVRASLQEQEIEAPDLAVGDEFPFVVTGLNGPVQIHPGSSEGRITINNLSLIGEHPGNAVVRWQQSSLQSRPELDYQFGGKISIKVLPSEATPAPWLIAGGIVLSAAIGITFFTRKKRAKSSSTKSQHV